MGSRVHTVIVVVLAASSARLASAQHVYWSDDSISVIRRASVVTGVVEDLVAPPVEWAAGLALHPAGDRLYWTDRGRGKIQSARLDGTDIAEALGVDDGINTPVGLAVDPVAGKLYWSEVDYDAHLGRIRRSNLDGANIESLMTLTHASLTREPNALALDVAEGRVYWTEGGTNRVMRADLNGANEQTLASTNIGVPYGIALDPIAQKIYWVNGGGPHRIERMNVDGSAREPLYDQSLNPIGLALDLAGGRVIWSDYFTGGTYARDMGGGNAVLLAPWSGWALAVDAEATKVYSIGTDVAPLRRVSLDGSDPEELIVNHGVGVTGLVVSPLEGLMYWMVFGSRIYQGRLDGTDIHTVFESDAPQVGLGLALDGATHRMHWFRDVPEIGTTLAGVHVSGESFSEAAVLNSSSAQHVAIAGANAYFVDRFACAVRRVPITGGLPQTIHTDQAACPLGLAVHHAANRVFWTSPAPAFIRRSGPLGENVAALTMDPLGWPSLLAHSGPGAQVIWVDTRAAVIRRGPDVGGLGQVVADLSPTSSLSALVVDPRAIGDVDMTGRVDLRDFYSFQTCFTGAERPDSTAPCGFFDAHPTDRDVDLLDWSAAFDAFAH